MIKKISLTLDVSDIRPVGPLTSDSIDVEDLSVVSLTHSKLKGELKIFGSESSLKVLLESLEKESKSKNPVMMSMDNIISSLGELTYITKSLRTKSGGNKHVPRSSKSEPEEG